MKADDNVESAVAGGKVSRRWVLRSTASLTAGVVAAGTVSLGAANVETRRHETVVVEPDHDPLTGEIFDRERHHRWDTI